MPTTTYPRANTTGLAPAQTAEAADVLNAVTPLDQAIEDLRTGALEFQQIRLDPNLTPLTVSGGAITVSYSYHIITSAAFTTLATLNGANDGDIIRLGHASGSADILIGDYHLQTTAHYVDIMKTASGFVVLGGSAPKYHPYFRAYRSGTQAIAGSTLTKVQFNATSYTQINSLNVAAYDQVTNFRFTPRKLGIWRHVVQITFTTTIPINTPVILYLQKNGVTVAQKEERAHGGANFTIDLTDDDQTTVLGLTDYYEVWVQQNDAGSHNVGSGATISFWSTTLVAET